MNKKDFYDWKRHPVTQVIFSQLEGRISELKEVLAETAGKDPAQDRELVGAIRAYNDLLRIEFEDQEETA